MSQGNENMTECKKQNIKWNRATYPQVEYAAHTAEAAKWKLE
jgi:hypothetical protein